MAVNKVVYKHFEVKVSPAAAHAMDALLFGCGKIENDLNPDYNADLVNSVAFRASECKITRVVRKNADDENTVLYDGTPVNYFYLEYEPEDENDTGLFSITVKKSDGTDAMKVVTVPYGTNRRPVYATQDEALRARMTTAEDDIDDLETRMTTAEDDIDDLETRMTQAETDIDDLETRMKQAETDIDDLEQQVARVLDILPCGAGAHNSIYRGKSLGASVTAEQYAAIAAGTFDDLYIGDYWTIGGVTYRIAAFDYYLQTGDTPCTDHHAVIVPDGGLYDAAMNDNNTTDGGYYGSKLRTSGLGTAKASIESAFGAGHILNHRQYLCNAVTDGKPSGGSWYDSTIELMTEQNLMGGKIFAPASDGSSVPQLSTVDKSQYPLFAFRPDLISNRGYSWLRDVVSETSFAFVYEDGNAGGLAASNSFGVRPAFSIVG